MEEEGSWVESTTRKGFSVKGEGCRTVTLNDARGAREGSDGRASIATRGGTREELWFSAGRMGQDGDKMAGLATRPVSFCEQSEGDETGSEGEENELKERSGAVVHSLSQKGNGGDQEESGRRWQPCTAWWATPPSYPRNGLKRLGTWG